MNLLYISISGNTRSFAKRIQQHSEIMHQENPDFPIIQLKEIHDNSPFEKEESPYFVSLPTYLEGGNGVDSGDQEILTQSMREYIEYAENAALCLGVIGSGNKNFGHQYCLTAKQYAAQFDVPVVADFELRGNQKEIEKIYQKLATIWFNHETTNKK
ncbi:class Ib ribonucleoside-diphosphate reductase assembly flavoprotein NrdI [Enterococcus lemanii]|uniref:Class Ib ribonucleoside-diphosphate reductase assembly flavoprotein NrdI n=1 Tax=Enterococcus lemanii TaxID=1159752 RepID=A0ABV9MUG6_9ENTE|nr:class Ib ribonucleoside-diphosphate reductase assembly flavoprotein NrdI [Enterococcus lemanii]MBM7709006.1 protein involved in ribonucleotide reduction [Enterococcus lemanii]